jgi:uncharacterized coiled-coil protein SlyX
MNERIVRLEEALAHVDRHVDELDEVVQALYNRVEALQAELERFKGRTNERIGWLAEREDDTPSDTAR